MIDMMSDMVNYCGISSMYLFFPMVFPLDIKFSSIYILFGRHMIHVKSIIHSNISTDTISFIRNTYWHSIVSL